jgi:hypothetical protein
MAYRAFFHERTTLPEAEQVWHAYALFKFQFYVWLALRNRCWTTERLARRGLPTHALCPLCATANETMDHLSLQCPFAIRVWTAACQRLQLGVQPPTPQSTLATWWPSAVANLPRRDSKHANSFNMLTMRFLWLERNARVFDGALATAASVLSGVLDEWASWVSCRDRGGTTRDVT